MEKKQNRNSQFFKRCENCPNLGSHVHINGKIRAIEEDSIGIEVIYIKGMVGDFKGMIGVQGDG